MKRLFLILFAITLIISIAFAEDIPSSYQYSDYHAPIAAPAAYTLRKSYFPSDIAGVDNLTNLRDAAVSNDRVYVLLENTLYVLNHNFELIKKISEYEENGETVPFSDMTGVAKADDGSVYICSQKTGQILQYDKDLKLTRIIPKPYIAGFENIAYRPIKLAVDSAGRMYVVAKGMYEGIAELNPDGSFSRFFGVNLVKFSPAQYIWRLFATKEQRERQVLWLPTDFTNLSIDKRGFIFATIQDEKGRIIKKLNSKGENILRVKDARYPKGDELFNRTGSGIPTGPSAFIAVDTNEYGVFACLDQKRGRVFAYNEDGRLLFVLGGLGMRDGLFRNPVDVDFVGKNLMVLDSLAQSIDLYEPTEYGNILHLAVESQYNFDYDNAKINWEKVLSYNHNLSLAYSGIGRTLLRRGEYEEAMYYLKQGYDQEYYSKAFEKVRNQKLKENFVPFVGIVFGLAVIRKAVKIIRRKVDENK